MLFSSSRRMLYDVIVSGGTCAAYGAALQARLKGQTVLHISRHTSLLREASWNFLPDARIGETNAWEVFRRELEGCCAWRDGLADGACSEIIAAALGRRLGIEFLFYAAPIGLEINEQIVHRAVFLTKNGVIWIAGRHWIDASEDGELVGLCDPGWVYPKATGFESSIVFRHEESRQRAPRIELGKIPSVDWMELRAGIWENESILRFGTPGQPREQMIEVLRATRGLPELADAVVSHASFVPLPVLEAPGVIPMLPLNLEVATAFSRTGETDWASLFDHGVFAMNRLSERPQGTGETGGLLQTHEANRESFDVVVAGLGTAGALAALAAAREGATVGAFDLMPCPGGTGTVGDIHLYYFGVQGGLQREVDALTAEWMPLFGDKRSIAGFHPVAKALALEHLLAESGVRVLLESFLGEVRMSNQRLKSADVATSAGRARWSARAWVDATGDGDLAALSGAPWEGSNRMDGLPSAFSQASGRFQRKDGRLFLRIMNFDAGYVDATCSGDLSRARLQGLSHYETEHFSSEHRPSFIAPLLGVRQSRHFQTLERVTLANLVERSQFPDAVGYTACHLDSHAIDFEFEGEETAFWLWGCRNWRVRMACQIPFRSLIPRSLENLLIAGRAVGATPEAHQSFRMQRDMQRVGEVAGIGSAIAARSRCHVSQIPLFALREKLMKTGALDAGVCDGRTFGYNVPSTSFQPPIRDVPALIESTRQGFGPHMFLLYLEGRRCRSPLLELVEDQDPETSWRGAVVLAMLRDPAAEPRLLRAVETREYGFAPDDPKRPEVCQRLAPNWLAALVFLRSCASSACVPIIEAIAQDATLVHNARTAIALLVNELAQAPDLSFSSRTALLAILDHLLASPAPNSRGAPQRTVVGVSEKPVEEGVWYPVVIDDFSWQLHFAVARALRTLGEPPHPGAAAFLKDPRGFVRRAFQKLHGHTMPHAEPAAVVA